MCILFMLMADEKRKMFVRNTAGEVCPEMAMPVRKIRGTRAKKRDQNELALRDRNGLAFRAP